MLVYFERKGITQKNLGIYRKNWESTEKYRKLENFTEKILENQKKILKLFLKL
jgi:hypothetical protein